VKNFIVCIMIGWLVMSGRVVKIVEDVDGSWIPQYETYCFEKKPKFSPNGDVSGDKGSVYMGKSYTVLEDVDCTKYNVEVVR